MSLSYSRLLKFACAFALGFVSIQHVGAEPTGYVSDTATMGINCGAANTVCYGSMSVLDKIYFGQNYKCRTPNATTGACPISDRSNPGIDLTRSANAPLLGQKQYDSMISYNALFSHKDLAGTQSYAPTQFLGCATGSAPDYTGQTIYACNFKHKKYLYDGTTGIASFGPEVDGPQFQIIQLTAIGAYVGTCAGYIPGLGCPGNTGDRTAETHMCQNSGADASSPIKACFINPGVGNPINVLTGAKVEFKTDIAWPIAFARTYSSARSLSSPYSLGMWSHNHESKLLIVNSNSDAPFVAALRFKLETGQEVVFTRKYSTSAFVNAHAEDKAYVLTVGNGYQLTLPNKEVRSYGYSGYMTSRVARNGYTLNYSYDNSGRLYQIMDSYGRGLAITFSDYANAIIQVSTLGTAGVDTVDYEYTAGMLTAAKFNLNEVTSYGYSGSKLVGISDPLGQTYAQFTYDGNGKAIQSKHMAGSNPVEVVDVTYGGNSVTATENGASSVYATERDAVNFHKRATVATLGNSASSYQVGYGSDGRPMSLRVGSATESYAFNATSLLPTSMTRRDGVVVTMNWDHVTRLLISTSEPSARGTRTTSFTWDAAGNMLSQTVASSASGSRSKSWTYGTFGKVLTATDVDGTVTTYSYYSDSDASPEKRGRLQSVTNPLGHQIVFQSYDSRGNPTAVLDENNVQSVMSYDTRGRLLSKVRAGVSTAYVYDLAGQLLSSSSSNGYGMTMSYDSAHRVTSVSDTNGESRVIGYDAYSNPVQDSSYQGSNLIIQMNRTFTALKQPKSQWAATPGESNSVGYDANGFTTSRVDGIGRTSTYSFNAFGVPIGYSEPGMSLVSLNRDNDGNLTTYGGGGVGGTSYTWNDFKELISYYSPDSGGYQSVAIDPIARTSARTDSASITHTTAKDALGRVVSVNHVLGGTTMAESFAYDTNGKGYLASATDSESSQTWTWNTFGLPLTKTQVVAGLTQAISYGYDGQGQLTSMTYPSGLAVGYGWAGGRVTSVSVNGVAFITNIAYRPFSSSPVSWTWASGGSYVKSFDANGKVTGVSDTGVIAQTTAFDGAFRLSSLSDTGLSLTPSYSTGDQLAGVTVNGQTQAYTFDYNWNRKTRKNFGGFTENFSITYQTNKLYNWEVSAGLTKYFAYDSRLNMMNNGRGVFAYDVRGNMQQATQNSVVATYGYNAFNRRVRKTVGGVSTFFLHDEMGNLAGEYSASNATLGEHVYLGNLPIGFVQGGQVMAVHTDYLGTPRAITNGSTLVWKWDLNDPFGGNTPSVQAMTYNQRFAGQYFDAETGLHHNRYRTYDPQLGRYLQADPIGLAGGKNPYNYVNQSPLNRVDPDGLLNLYLVRDGKSFSFDHLMAGIPVPGGEEKIYGISYQSSALRENVEKTQPGPERMISGSGIIMREFGAVISGGLIGKASSLAEVKVNTRDEMLERYLGAGRQSGEVIGGIEVLSFHTTPEEDRLFELYISKIAANMPYSFVGFGNSCGNGVGSALEFATGDKSWRGIITSARPSSVFDNIVDSDFVKSRGGKVSTLIK